MSEQTKECAGSCVDTIYVYDVQSASNIDSAIRKLGEVQYKNTLEQLSSECNKLQARIDELETKLTKTCEAYEDKLHKMFLAGASSADKITGLKEQLSRAEECLRFYSNKEKAEKAHE